MAFSVKQTKAKLQEYGVPPEQLDAAAEYFCATHNTDLDAIREERDELRRSVETLTAAKAELDAIKARPADGYRERYEKVKADFDKFRADTEAEKLLAAKKAAYTEVCKDAGLSEKGVAKAVKYADWNAIELDEAGKVKDARAHIKALKEEWAEHVVTMATRGADTPNPPANNGSSRMTLEQIDAIEDTAARQAAIAANHELFGI